MFQFMVDLVCVFLVVYGLLRFIFWWKVSRNAKKADSKSETK